MASGINKFVKAEFVVTLRTCYGVLQIVVLLLFTLLTFIHFFRYPK